MSNKKALRQSLRTERLALSPYLTTLYSKKITDNLLSLMEYQQAKYIGCYLSVQNEVDLSFFIQKAWHMQKNTFLPALDGANEMHFYPYTFTTELSKNKYGIAEPTPLRNHQISPFQLDILVVPLLAFDRTRNRLGQGAGYYDRYLALYENSEKRPVAIGVAYDFQKIDRVPIDEWDIPLDIIVSEKYIY